MTSSSMPRYQFRGLVKKEKATNFKNNSMQSRYWYSFNSLQSSKIISSKFSLKFTGRPENGMEWKAINFKKKEEKLVEIFRTLQFKFSFWEKAVNLTKSSIEGENAF